MIADLSRAYLQALASPRGRGDLDPADAAGEVGSVVGGSGVRVTLALEPERASYPARIRAVAWRAFGSAAPYGPGSVLADALPGATVADAARVEPADLLSPLGPRLPGAVLRAADHLVSALRLALRFDDAARAAARADAPGVLVCRCLAVGDRVVRRAIRSGAGSVASVGEATSAGHGCHSCWPDLRVLLDEETVRTAPVPPDPLEPLDPLDRAISAVIRPVLRAQGLALGGVRIEGGVVRLSIARAAVDALASPVGAVALARHALRETIAEDLRVELYAPRAGVVPPG